MAIYKPNNFYPYMQEIDLESLDGTIFSCQANTDGDSMVHAARLRILDKDKNIVLYEKIHNLDKPVKNGEIIEFKVEPYVLETDTSFKLNFVSLNPKMDISKRKDFCPYNLYQSQIYNNSYFKIIAFYYSDVEDSSGTLILDSKEEINSYVINYNEDLEEKYSISMNNINSEYTIRKFYIMLKNNRDYIWNIELFGHKIMTEEFEGNYIGEGKIVGSVDSTIWINENVQLDEYLIKKDKIEVDQYVGYNINEFNSDILKHKLSEGYTLHGQLSIEQKTPENKLYQDYLNGNFYSNITYNKYVISDYNSNATYKGDVDILDDDAYICNVGNTQYYFRILSSNDFMSFGDYYEIDNNNNNVLKSNASSLDFLNNIGISPAKGYSMYYNFSLVGLPYRRFSEEEINDTPENYFLQYQWKYMDGVKITEDKTNEKLVLYFDNAKFVDNSDNIADIYCFNISPHYHPKYVDQVKGYNGNDLSQPFIVKNAETTVIVTDKEAIGENVVELTCVNDSNKKMNAFPNEQVYKIGDKYYRTRVLIPKPYSPTWCVRNATTINSKTYYYPFIKLSSNNDFSNLLSGEDDYYCYINHIPNALETIYRPLLNFKFGAEESNNNKLNFKLKGCVTQLFDVASNQGYTLSFETIDSIYSTDIELYIIDVQNSNTSIVLDVNLNQSGNIYQQDILIPYYFIEPQIRVVFKSNFKKFSNVSLENVENKTEKKLILSKNTISDLSVENLYLNYSDKEEANFENYINFKSFEVEKIINNYISLKDKKIENELMNMVSDDKTIYYYLSYNGREKISWKKDLLGVYKNILKLELENNLPYVLQNNSEIYLYETDNEHTYNSFFGKKDLELNIDNLYVRFPGYVGEDINGNLIYDVVPYISSITKEKEGEYANSNALTYSDYPRLYYKDDFGDYKVASESKEWYQGWFFNNSQNYYSRSQSGNNYYQITPQIYKKTNNYTLNSKGHQPNDIYGINVRKEAFEQQGDVIVINNDNYTSVSADLPTDGFQPIYCKLFKITSYDIDTGEFVFAGGLKRKILDTDKYEIWEANIIEGSSNEYDITETIQSYSRVLPLPNEDTEIFVGGNRIMNNPIKILNNSISQLFIQPNINLLVSEYNFPYIELSDKKNEIRYNCNQNFFTVKDVSIDKLDNTQWLIINNSNIKIDTGDYYKIFMDTVVSENSYFYGRNTEELKLYNISSNVFNEDNLDPIPSDINLFDAEMSDDGQYSIIKTMDFYLYGVYIHKEPLKRYYIKIYDYDMNLIYDSKYVYDSKILYRVKGLNNNSIYYMTIDCENQLGDVVVYEHMFVTDYVEVFSIGTNDTQIKLKLENDCEQSGIIVSFINQNEDYCTMNDFNNVFISKNSNIRIYRRNQNGNLKLIHTINLHDDKVYYEYSEYGYKYAFIDYNVSNDEKYEYIAVLEEDSSAGTYSIIKSEIITSFNAWTLVEIIENEDDHYSVIGDVWNFRYNLESEGLTQNTSTTTWDTLGQYGQVGKGEKNYISSGLRCLLGDVGYYQTHNNEGVVIKKYGYNEKLNNPLDGVVNNILKYKKWTKFCNTFTKKLLKDLKGNKWIVQIVDNPSTENADNSHEQIYTISFTWHEVGNSDDISICNNLESIENMITMQEKIKNIKYYGVADIVPTDISAFTFSYDDSNMTASISLKSESEYIPPYIPPVEGEDVEIFPWNMNRNIVEDSNDKGLKNIIIPYEVFHNEKKYKVTKIANNGFENSAVKNIKIPKSITSIGNNAFANCTNLNDFDMFKNIETFGDYVFADCSGFKSVKISDNVLSIGEGLFANCENIVEIQVDENNLRYSSIDGVLFDKDCTTLVQYPSEKTESFYFVPDTVQTINGAAFYRHDYLKEIYFSKNIKTIGNAAFFNCDNLSKIYYSGTSEDWIQITINEGSEDFENVNRIYETVIVTEEYCVFDESTDTYTVGGGNEKTYNISGYVIIPSTINGFDVVAINDSAFKNEVDSNQVNKNLIGCKMFDTIEYVGASAFYKCMAMTEIQLSSNLTNIDNYAFYCCTQLKSITIPNTVRYISESAFRVCNSLTTVTIPTNVTSIANRAFSSCINLGAFIVSDNHQYFSVVDGVLFNKDETFLKCYPGGKSGEYSISETVTRISPYAFEGCHKLTSIVINDKITNIPTYTFNGCTALTTVTIPTNVTSIKEYAFNGCKNLTTVNYQGTEAEWNSIIISKTGNDMLTNATIKYNSESITDI